MIYIFHGDNQKESRSALNTLIATNPEANILRLAYKRASLETINNFLTGTSLLSANKILFIDGFFSILKARDKIIKLLNQNQQNTTIILWQSKKLTVTQLKNFPSAKINHFPLPNTLWNCLSAVKPGSLSTFLRLYSDINKQHLYDLFLYLLKNNLRKQIGSFSSLPQDKLIKTYLLLIELDYQNKSGQLNTPKEIALERIIINLLS
ncbi:hypothetical protein KJ909_03290 [Patescibacteria group bacterium]|nr:hypothetical protein [Patescibacteria group bacterium]